MRWLVLVLLALTTAQAGTSQDPEITDPADAPLQSADILSVWLDNVTSTTFGIHIRLVALTEEPELVEVGVRLLLADQYSLVGLTDIPGVYAGGFHCPGQAADFNSPDESQCGTLEYQIADDAIHLTVPRATVGASAESMTSGLMAYAELFGGPDGGLDQTAEGRPFAFDTEAVDILKANPTAPPEETPTGAAPVRESPVPAGIAALFVGSWWTRKR